MNLFSYMRERFKRSKILSKTFVLILLILASSIFFSVNESGAESGKSPSEDSEPLKLDTRSPEEILLSKEIFYMKDSTKSLPANEIIGGEYDSAFRRNTNRIPNFGYDSSPYWLHFKIEVEEPLSEERFLKIEYPHLDKIDLYWKDTLGREGEFHTGDSFPFKERPFNDRFFVFPLPLEDKSVVEVYFKVESEGSLTVPTYLTTRTRLEESSKISLLFNGIFFGALGVMVFYNFFLFLGIREKAYLYYTIVVFAFTLFAVLGSGYGFWLFLSDYPKFLAYLFVAVAAIAMIFLGLFSAEYLQTKNSHPRLHIALQGIIAVWIVYLLSAIYVPLRILLPISAILPILEILLLVVISVLRVFQNDRKAKIFLAAWVLGLIGTIIFSLNRLGVYDSEPVASGALKFGLLSNVILLSLGLVDRINTFRKEKDEYKERADQLLELSLLDPLTGVANRRFFDQELDREWNRSVRTERPLSLLMIDVDYFKAFNDTYGHLKGDEVLERVAQSLKECLNRSSDMISRYGGEEFGVILPDTPVEGAIVVALNMLQTVEDMNILHEKSPFSRVTVSIGVSSNLDREIHSPEELLGIADKNLYDAKSFGRNHIRH
ncbi:diguanylate cyclase [Leptospira fainei]|nr:diguanylate cyclase [Leptospira fainei]